MRYGDDIALIKRELLRALARKGKQHPGLQIVKVHARQLSQRCIHSADVCSPFAP